ncbi:hypothetical protein EJ104_12995, partial [Deinococcus radiophilus]
ALLQPLGSSQAPLLKLGTRILVRLPFHGPWSLAAHTCAAINKKRGRCGRISRTTTRPALWREARSSVPMETLHLSGGRISCISFPSWTAASRL